MRVIIAVLLLAVACAAEDAPVKPPAPPKAQSDAIDAAEIKEFFHTDAGKKVGESMKFAYKMQITYRQMFLKFLSTSINKRIGEIAIDYDYKDKLDTPDLDLLIKRISDISSQSIGEWHAAGLVSTTGDDVWKDTIGITMKELLEQDAVPKDFVDINEFVSQLYILNTWYSHCDVSFKAIENRVMSFRGKPANGRDSIPSAWGALPKRKD